MVMRGTKVLLTGLGVGMLVSSGAMFHEISDNYKRSEARREGIAEGYSRAQSDLERMKEVAKEKIFLRQQLGDAFVSRLEQEIDTKTYPPIMRPLKWLQAGDTLRFAMDTMKGNLTRANAQELLQKMLRLEF